MKVLILGANGRVGSRVAEKLLEAGHTVKAVVHKSKENVPVEAKIVTVDIHDRSALAHELANVDAVVCALSSWKAPHHDVLSTAMKSVISAMEQAGVARIVTISGDVARVPGEREGYLSRLFHVVAFGAIRSVVTDSEDHVRQLYESSLDWTVLRPAIMSSSSKETYRLQNRHPLSPFIPRAAVVKAIVDLVESDDCSRHAPFIASA